ncbi:MAG: hypothetical protein ACYSYU_00240 [Planctomycetota bacterium]|jgi:hypothetical protein
MPRAQKIVNNRSERRQGRQDRRSERRAGVDERRDDRADRKVDAIDAKTNLNNSKAAKRKWLVILIGVIIGGAFGLKFFMGF